MTRDHDRRPSSEPPSITCPACGLRSFHPRDIAERFCGGCESFHEDMPAAGLLDAVLRGRADG